MSDNKTLQTAVATPPSGTVLASDEIGGVDYPRAKISLGADGTAVDWGAGAGAVGTNTGRVTLGSDDPAVVSLQLIDNAISGNEMQVDVLTTVLPVPAATGTVTSVADTAASTTLLSSSSSRRGFRLYNTSTQIAYVKYGTTASATDFTVKIYPDSYLEENHYYGRVDALWAADASGAMLITELT